MAMPPAMVRVTAPPSSMAPRNSKMPAMSTADHSFNVLEPIEVPKAARGGAVMMEGGAKGRRET